MIVDVISDTIVRNYSYVARNKNRVSKQNKTPSKIKLDINDSQSWSQRSFLYNVGFLNKPEEISLI